MKQISAVVCVLNEEKRIESCLKSLCDQTIPRKSYEIIVVDGNSTDNTAKIAKKYADVVMVGNYRPLGNARQAGLVKAQSRIVAFTDGDTIVPDYWIEKFVKAFGDGVVGASGPLRALEKNTHSWIKTGLWVWSKGIKLFGLLHLGGLVGPNFAVDKEKALSVGGFRNIQIEDSDLALRIARVGKIIYLDDNPVKTSVRRAEKWGFLKTFYFSISNNIQVFLRMTPSFYWEKID